MSNIFIKLDEDDFRCLVSGGILKIAVPHEPQYIHICLADIGFHRMDKAITDVDTGTIETYSNRNRNNPSGWV